MKKDVKILRELAKEVMEIASKPIQNQRRDGWRKLNSNQRVKPLIYMRSYAFNEYFDFQSLKCEDPFFRGYEYRLHVLKFQDSLEDDFIIEPWLTVDAIFDTPVEKRWGIDVQMGEKPTKTGAAAFKPNIIEEEDINKLVAPKHSVNEVLTKERFDKLNNAIGDIMEVNLNRGSIFQMWNMDISTDLGKLRGMEQLMLDVYDRPEWLHKLLSAMENFVLKVHGEAEEANDFSLANHQNQAMPYSMELEDPKPNVFGRKRKDLWAFMASQEYTSFGPDHFYEFMLQYQIPILEKFGLVAYGCCEDVTQKIKYIKKIPNLRRIAVTPYSDTRKCAEQIGKDYIISWRPSPSLMLSTGLDEDLVRKHMRDNFAILKQNNCIFDITLKDVETVNNQPENIPRWVQIVREEIDKAF